MIWSAILCGCLCLVSGALIFYAGVRTGARLQWAAGNDEEPFGGTTPELPEETD